MANIFKSKYTGEQIEQILDKANNVTDIKANNGEPTTETLVTIKIGNTNYILGGNVEPNPSEEATEELTKIKINGVVYSIASGSTSADTITFTIAGVSYNATNGMTWREWVNSAYNTGGFTNNTADNAVRTSNGSQCINGDLQLQTKTIVGNTAYTLVTYSHSGGSA